MSSALESRAERDTRDPPAYPEHWSHEVVLADGGLARVRPVRPSDRDALLGLHQSLSSESRYLRYFTARSRLPLRELVRATRVDYADHMRFVGFEGDRLIGFAQYDRKPGEDAAEVALHIEDAHQGRGLGTILLEHLAAYAHEHGLHRLTGIVLPQNHKMLEVFRDAGYPKISHFADGVVEVSIRIDPTMHSREVISERHRRAVAERLQRTRVPTSSPLQKNGRAGTNRAVPVGYQGGKP